VQHCLSQSLLEVVRYAGQKCTFNLGNDRKHKGFTSDGIEWDDAWSHINPSNTTKLLISCMQGRLRAKGMHELTHAAKFFHAGCAPSQDLVATILEDDKGESCGRKLGSGRILYLNEATQSPLAK